MTKKLFRKVLSKKHYMPPAYNKNNKLNIGVFTFTCCEGCQFEVIELEERLLELNKAMNLSYFKMLRESYGVKPMDIAIVEGTITSKENIKKLKQIRKNAKSLVALGACAAFGGITSVRNHLPEELKKKITETTKQETEAWPIGKYVKVDYIVRGCPIQKEEFYSLMVHLVHGLKPKEKDFSVCVECKQNENECLLIKEGFCMGPIITAGCDSLCPNNGAACDGCRGFYSDANFDSFKKLLQEKGFSLKEINEKIGKYYFHL